MKVNFRIYTNGCHMLYPPYSHDYGTKKGIMDSVLFFYPNGIWGVGIIKKKEISAIAHHSNSILMMDTGQKDKNGRNIYEGDIVAYYIGGKSLVETENGIKIDEESQFKDYHINEIVFSGGAFGVKAKGTQYPIWDSERNIEVLGNKYQNKELLEDCNN